METPPPYSPQPPVSAKLTAEAIPWFLSVLAPLALVAVLFVLVFFEANPGGRDMLNIALGALITLAKDVYGFWFGSSLGSRLKDNQP